MLINQCGTSLRSIAGLLALPLLKILDFTHELDEDPRALDGIPARSSSVQDLTICPEQSGANERVTVSTVTTVSALLSKFTSLERLDWRIQLRDPYLEVVSTIGLVRESLQHLVFKVDDERNVLPAEQNFPGSVRAYPHLTTIESYPEFLVREPDSSNESDIFDHHEKSIGYLSGLLPSSLTSLHFVSVQSSVDRSSRYWLYLIKDILTDRHRFSPLRYIEIVSQNSWKSTCSRCRRAVTRGCCLCNKNKISDTMKQLCKYANVELKIMRNAGPLINLLDNDDPASYVDGKVLYVDATTSGNCKFSSVQDGRRAPRNRETGQISTTLAHEQ